MPSAATSSTTSNNQTQGTSTNNNVSATNPWAVQTPYLTQAMSGASSALPTSASYVPGQLTNFTNEVNAGQNQTVPTGMATAGTGLLNTGAGGAAAGVTGLENFNPASTNNANAIVSGGNQYVANSNIAAETAAAMQGANIEANYVTNPGIDSAAAGSGNINSSRDAIEHGLVATNLANTAANTNATLTANAFNTGAGLTENALSANNTANLGALTGLTTGSGYVANAGTSADTGSITGETGLYGLSNTGMAGQTTDPYAPYSGEMGVVGGTGYGSTSSSLSGATNAGTSSTQGTATPSTLSQIGGWINTIGSLL